MDQKHVFEHQSGRGEGDLSKCGIITTVKDRNDSGAQSNDEMEQLYVVRTTKNPELTVS